MISNIDSIFFSIDIKDYESKNKKLLTFLDENKSIANSNKLENHTIELKGKQFIILPNGARFHAYILHNDSLEIKIAQARSNSKYNYPISIRIKSLFLWEKGFINAYMETIEYIKQLFKGDHIGEKLSRVDLCCHTDKLKISNDESYKNFKGNFKKTEYFYYNRKLNGLTFGTFAEKNIMCRIYDKSLEIKTSGKTWFNDIWQQENLDIENVWNVEFQIGRKFLKDYEIETVQDLILKTRSIWEYLTCSWLTFINLDNDNISRCSIKDEWLNIQNAYLDYCSGELIKREKQLNRNAEELIPLLVGVLTSYGACKQKIVLDKVIKEFKEDLNRYLEEKKDNAPIEKLFYEKLEFMFS